MPPSPDGPPPNQDEGENENEDEEDQELLETLAIREIAVKMAGDEDRWDDMDEDRTRRVLDAATIIYFQGRCPPWKRQ
jgi:hypothetical protein